MTTINLDPEVQKYLEEQEARRRNIESPEYQSQLAASRRQDFESSTAPQQVAAYAKAFSQLGTLKGQAADTSSVSDFAKSINQQQAAARQQEMQDQQDRDKQTGLRMQTLQFLQGRADKQSDLARQEQAAEMADKRARDLAQMQSDRSFALASMQDKRAREMEDIRNQNAIAADERRAARDMDLVRLKGEQELAQAQAKLQMPDKAAQKSEKELDYRYVSLRNNADKLKDLVGKYGTMEMAGPQAAEMDSLIYQMAVDYAKMVDPDSVAREGEVSAAQKYMLPFRQGMFDKLTTKNKTAEQMIDNYKQSLDERLAARRAGMSGDIEAKTYQAAAPKVPEGTAFAAPATQKEWKSGETFKHPSGAEYRFNGTDFDLVE